MGYWMRKREISAVTALLTIRGADGEKVGVLSHLIDSPRAYEFRASQILSQMQQTGDDFFGSLEIEIFSAVDMVFPYPAITFAYESSLGTTFVHTCGRVFNDFDDLNENEEQQVPEAGFDVLTGADFSPFFAFVNGPLEMRNESFQIEIIDATGRRQTIKRSIDRLSPYATAWIRVFANEQDRKGLAGDKVTVKIHHDFKGFFPRFVAGNEVGDSRAISLTHSFYDSSDDRTDGAIYPNPDPENFFDSAIAVPMSKNFDLIELAVYPVLADCPTELAFELYDADGNKLADGASRIELGGSELRYIDLVSMFETQLSNLSVGLCKITAHGDGRVPTRLKFGLNLGRAKGDVSLPSNICFAAGVPNAKLLEKPGTFKWCTIFANSKQRIYLHNVSFLRQTPKKEIAVTAMVCRTDDDETLSLEMTLRTDGTVELFAEHGPTIEAFLDGQTGWVSFDCKGPFVSGYYVTDNGHGVVGADHIY